MRGRRTGAIAQEPSGQKTSAHAASRARRDSCLTSEQLIALLPDEGVQGAEYVPVEESERWEQCAQ
ncbi:hypothetical protein [Brevibacillus centrosporus]|uniref:hypothetical protein n=1 Tax=Brevibacillus centrosporus TaxID=54910 RepID=UPI002E216466|nr:hypothetical protein [Brevibacillus centrosporus]